MKIINWLFKLPSKSTEGSAFEFYAADMDKLIEKLPSELGQIGFELEDVYFIKRESKVVHCFRFIVFVKKERGEDA